MFYKRKKAQDAARRAVSEQRALVDREVEGLCAQGLDPKPFTPKTLHRKAVVEQGAVVEREVRGFYAKVCPPLPE